MKIARSFYHLSDDQVKDYLKDIFPIILGWLPRIAACGQQAEIGRGIPDLVNRVSELQQLLEGGHSADAVLTELASVFPLLNSSVNEWIDDIESARFRRSWDFFAELLLRPQEVDDFLDDQEQRFEKDIQRYGLGPKAKVLYAKRALCSIGPYLKWIFPRLAGFKVLEKVVGVIGSFFHH